MIRWVRSKAKCLLAPPHLQLFPSCVGSTWRVRLSGRILIFSGWTCHVYITLLNLTYAVCQHYFILFWSPCLLYLNYFAFFLLSLFIYLYILSIPIGIITGGQKRDRDFRTRQKIKHYTAKCWVIDGCKEYNKIHKIAQTKWHWHLAYMRTKAKTWLLKFWG